MRAEFDSRTPHAFTYFGTASRRLHVPPSLGVNAAGA